MVTVATTSSIMVTTANFALILYKKHPRAYSGQKPLVSRVTTAGLGSTLAGLMITAWTGKDLVNII